MINKFTFKREDPHLVSKQFLRQELEWAFVAISAVRIHISSLHFLSFSISKQNKARKNIPTYNLTHMILKRLHLSQWGKKSFREAQ